MGIEFRGSFYKRDVSFGKRTVKDGEAVAVWNRLGTHHQVVGPRLVRLFFSTIVFLDKRIAGPNEYLVVTNVNGTVEHIRGPIALFENPVFHRSMEIKSAFSLTSVTECIVINREVRQNLTNSKTGAIVESSCIERLVISGPNLYFPLVGDSVVTFKWSGRHPTNSPQDFSISQGVDCFAVLTTSMRQWKVDLPFQVVSTGRANSGAATANVRGSVQITVCFTITDITALLDNSTDLIGDLYDAMVVDMAVLGASDAAGEVNAKSLNNIIRLFTSFEATFPHLTERAGTTGVTLNGFAYRGFEPDKHLVRYLEELAEVDSRIYRERMLADQDEKRIQADLTARQARLEHEQNLQQAQLAADRNRLVAEQEYEHAVSEHAIRERKAAAETDMLRMRKVNDEALRVLSTLNSLGVDLTTLLTHKPCAQTSEEVNGQLVNGSKGMALVTRAPALVDVFATTTTTDITSDAKRNARRSTTAKTVNSVFNKHC